jgi:EAL domain-containing protein (putative c-di-GMP-specific phosphodiesterase class I)
LSDEHKIYVTASIGVTLYPKEDSDADRLLRHADQAMYQAKDRGRNRCELFDIEKNRTEKTRQRQIERIEYAIKDQEFVLHYQPKVNMRTGALIGVEALIRWQHPDDGLVGPNEFLPLIAGTEQAVKIDKWVIAEALRQIIRFKAEGLEIAISVNIDGMFLQSPDFVSYLKSQLKAYPEVAPSLLELEILESTALIDLDSVRRVIETCQNLGVTVALDDFGTGYSSLTYLKNFPCDTLKIDKSFIIDLLGEPESRSLVEGVISLAKAFNRRVLAEGVETEAHGQMLLSMGCEYGQGYGIQRPIPAKDLLDWIRSNTPPKGWKNVADNVYWLGHQADKNVSSPTVTTPA